MFSSESARLSAELAVKQHGCGLGLGIPYMNWSEALNTLELGIAIALLAIIISILRGGRNLFDYWFGKPDDPFAPSPFEQKMIDEWLAQALANSKTGVVDPEVYRYAQRLISLLEAYYESLHDPAYSSNTPYNRRRAKRIEKVIGLLLADLARYASDNPPPIPENGEPPYAF